MRLRSFILIPVSVVAGLGAMLYALAARSPSQAESAMRKESPMFQMKTSAFQPQGSIPSRFTCEGENISPEIAWSGAPQGTRSFALVMHDPDAPRRGGYTHWVIFNIPATASEIPENAPKQADLPGGGIQGRNDDGGAGYTGPCPPSGTHRYYFRLYALDKELNLKDGADKDALEKALKGHVLGQAEIMGRYKRGAGKAA